MPRAHLQDTITRLRREIDAGAPLSPEQRRALSDALSEIETLLESDTATAAGNDSILAELREAEARFEQSHPNFSYAVRAVINALSNLGI